MLSAYLYGISFTAKLSSTNSFSFTNIIEKLLIWFNLVNFIL